VVGYLSWEFIFVDSCVLIYGLLWNYFKNSNISDTYRGVLLNTLLHAIVYVLYVFFTQFAECSNTDCKLNGITKINIITTSTQGERK
jgi:hypothetical protein